MSIMDCHLHSSLSFDSSEDMENYVRLAKANGDKCFITTEHMDLESNFDNKKDIIADFGLQQQIIRNLSEKYDMDVLFGIEVGWRSDIHRRNLEIVEKYPFDMVILSVHETLDCDVAFPEFSRGRTTDECYAEYLSLIRRAVENFDNFDTLAHIDYVLRYTGHTDLDKHRSQLTEIMQLLIAGDKALEINTKLVPQPQAMERLEYIIRLYTSLGGKKVTLGSDAHKLKYYKNGFDLAVQLLKKYGIYEICTYKKRKEHRILL